MPNELFIPTIPDLPGPGMGATDRFNQAFLSTLGKSGTPSAAGTGSFKTAQDLLAPGEGGLSTTLQRLYDMSVGKIDQATAGNIASAQTGALGRGLEGSSIEQAGVGAAQYAGEQARASLLASLLGQQVGQTSQLAQGLFGAGQQEAGFGMDQLLALLQFLSGQGEGAANLSMFGQTQDQFANLARGNNQAGTTNALIGGGSAIAAKLLPILLA